MTTLNACYDLTIGPPQYDVLAFLLHVEMVRRGHECDDIDLTVAPRSYVKQLHWLDNIAVPMCRMLPTVKRLTILEEMPGDVLYGRNIPVNGRNCRFYGLDVMTKAWAVVGRCLRPIRELPKQDKTVTITLREATHWPERNSKKDEWVRAAHKIKDRGYDVVFVRDTEVAGEPLDPFPINPAASIDLEHRGALYRSAFCNMFVGNGPAIFAMAIDAPAIMLRPTNDALGSCYSRNYFRERGLTDQFPDCPGYQRIIYEDDTETNIVAGFDEWVKSQ